MAIKGSRIDVPSPRFALGDLHNGRSDKRSKGNADDTSESEDGHGQTTSFLSQPDITDTATDDVDGDGRGTATKESRHNQSRKVLCKGRGEKRDHQHDVRDKVSGHATGRLGQRHEDQWPEGSTHVPGSGGPVEVGERAILYVKLGFHPVIARSVCSCRKTCKDRAIERPSANCSQYPRPPGVDALHEADRDGQEPLVLHTPVERVLRVIRAIPGMHFNVLVGRHLIPNILNEKSLDPGLGLVRIPV